MEDSLAKGLPVAISFLASLWEDLVLPGSTAVQLKELLAWPEHGQRLIDKLQMAKTIQPVTGRSFTDRPEPVKR